MPTSSDVAIDEVAAATRLVGALVDTLVGPVQDTHRGIAGRVFGLLGPVAGPARLAHDAVAALTYGSVRGGARLVGGVAGAGVALSARGRDRRPISAHPRGAQALAFASGLLGEWLDGRADDLVVRPSLTRGGVAVTPGDDGATDRLVILVHGLAETTSAWSWWQDTSPSYADQLAAVDWTGLEVGYDTGRSVVASGAALAATIDELVATWPVPLAEVALVGHSMGGLVVAAACTDAVEHGAPWVALVSHVVTLATPHAGSWLAQAAHRGADHFARLPETRGLAAILDLRSPGIRDLTRGWRPADDLARQMPSARHAFVSSALRPPFDRIIGDGLVHRASAAAPAADHPNVVVRHHLGIGHIRLVNHPAVAADLLAWLSPRRDRALDATWFSSPSGREGSDPSRPL